MCRDGGHRAGKAGFLAGREGWLRVMGLRTAVLPLGVPSGVGDAPGPGASLSNWLCFLRDPLLLEACRGFHSHSVSKS